MLNSILIHRKNTRTGANWKSEESTDQNRKWARKWHTDFSSIHYRLLASSDRCDGTILLPIRQQTDFFECSKSCSQVVPIMEPKRASRNRNFDNKNGERNLPVLGPNENAQFSPTDSQMHAIFSHQKVNVWPSLSPLTLSTKYAALPL